MKKLFIASLGFLSILGFTACSNRSLNSGGALNTTLATPATLPTNTTPPSVCPSALQATLTQVTPAAGTAIKVGDSIIWRVDASGCSGRYAIEQIASASPFTSNFQYSKPYSQAGTLIESISVVSLDNTGAILARVSLNSPSFQVAANTPSTPIPDPPAPLLSPSCTVTRNSLVVTPGLPLMFSLQITGTATTATLNQMPVANAQAVLVNPSLLGTYDVYGTVSNAAGSSQCEFHFTPPSCTVAATKITYNSVLLRLTLKGQVSSAVMETVPVVLPTYPTNYVEFTKDISGNSPITSAATVRSAYGDVGSCSVTYSPVAPKIVNTVVSFWAREKVNLSMSATQINLSTQSIYSSPLGDFQVLAVYEDGSEAIVYSSFAPVSGSNSSVSLSGNFGSWILGNAHLATVRSPFFASLSKDSSNKSIAPGSNRDKIPAMSSIDGSQLTFNVSDGPSGSAYYQVAMCKTGYVCRY